MAFSTHASTRYGLDPPSYGSMSEIELYDTQLKGPVLIHPSQCIPTVGYQRFTSTFAGSGSGGRKVVTTKVCESYHAGHCGGGMECLDVHVVPEILKSARAHMTEWLNTKESAFELAKQNKPTETYRVFCADLKEVVEVPITHLTFTRGLFVDPAARSRRARPAGPSSHGFASSVASQAPTACGLNALDPSQCKWGRWCNQAHIDHTFMEDRRSRFAEWSRELEQKFLSCRPEESFSVHDPFIKQTLRFPRTAIKEFTRGIYQGSERKSPSVCMLFQNGRCTARGCCNQVHVLPEALTAARNAAGAFSPFVVEGAAGGGGEAHEKNSYGRGNRNLGMWESENKADWDRHNERGGSQGATPPMPPPPFGNGALNPAARPFVPPPCGSASPGRVSPAGRISPTPLQPIGPSGWDRMGSVGAAAGSEVVTPPQSPPQHPRGTPKGTPKQNNPYAEVSASPPLAPHTPSGGRGVGYLPPSPHFMAQLGEPVLHFSASPLLKPNSEADSALANNSFSLMSSMDGTN